MNQSSPVPAKCSSSTVFSQSYSSTTTKFSSSPNSPHNSTSSRITAGSFETGTSAASTAPFPSRTAALKSTTSTTTRTVESFSSLHVPVVKALTLRLLTPASSSTPTSTRSRTYKPKTAATVSAKPVPSSYTASPPSPPWKRAFSTPPTPNADWRNW